MALGDTFLSSGSHSGDLGLGTRNYADDRIVVQLLTVLVCLLPAILVCGLELGLALYQVLAFVLWPSLS